MTAVLEGGEWSATRPGRTLPPEKTRYPFYRRLGRPQGRSRRTENLVLTGIWFRTVQPLSQSLYRLSYRAHIFIWVDTQKSNLYISHDDRYSEFGLKVACYLYVSSSSSVICQTTGPKPLPKWFLHIVRSRASSFNWSHIYMVSLFLERDYPGKVTTLR